MRTDADRFARAFVTWAVDNGHIAELVREDVTSLARDHFAPASDISMPLDNHFFAALKKVAGVECLTSRAVYDKRWHYVGRARTTYRISAKVTERAARSHRHEVRTPTTAPTSSSRSASTPRRRRARCP